MNWTKLNWTDCNKSTQLHYALIRHACQRRDLSAAAKLGQFVLTCIARRPFTLEFSSVQFARCKRAFKLFAPPHFHIFTSTHVRFIVGNAFLVWRCGQMRTLFTKSCDSIVLELFAWCSSTKLVNVLIHYTSRLIFVNISYAITGGECGQKPRHCTGMPCTVFGIHSVTMT